MAKKKKKKNHEATAIYWTTPAYIKNKQRFARKWKSLVREY